ncbi:hypothetical protein [Rhodalgimonas zhirmunskyi]|uniref:Cbb3-type cytochrome oxidase component FixQ n=1 Tax=Rhodalgimonas zhirmunskyi TaxID=2964767 RepID=A0AAJ1X4P3_9RHOB|nr:hypothetical protein [Rhodoalgimonas zhirmunskyi]MDQ2093319.1 hypothetical protein [Rhodoalgimonas zhirmunskyi]
MDYTWMMVELDRELFGALAGFLVIAALAFAFWLEYRRSGHEPLNRGALRRLLERDDA